MIKFNKCNGLLTASNKPAKANLVTGVMQGASSTPANYSHLTSSFYSPEHAFEESA